MKTDQPVFVLRLTVSQRMALADIITTVMVPPCQMMEYHDVTNDVITTPDELLALVLNAPTDEE